MSKDNQALSHSKVSYLIWLGHGISFSSPLPMAKLFDWPADEIADTAWEQAQEDPTMFKIQDVDLLEKVKEGLSNDLWGTIEDSDPDTGTQAIAHLIKAVVHRPHGVVAAKIAAIGRIEAVKWDVGLTSGLTLLLAAFAEITLAFLHLHVRLGV